MITILKIIKYWSSNSYQTVNLITNFQGHIETIFDCKFKPESPDLLATASFDGTIKVWDVNTMTAVSVIFWFKFLFVIIFF